MKLLTFQARRFAYRAHSKTLEEVADVEVEEQVEETVVVFVHAEKADQAEEVRSRVFRHTLKHIKWLANKGSFERVVLHSFTHLGGDNAEPQFAQEFLEEMRQRLESTGYQVWCTPFGYFCEWELSVYGQSLAKVWKQI
jgi:hypothetical protein